MIGVGKWLAICIKATEGLYWMLCWPWIAWWQVLLGDWHWRFLQVGTEVLAVCLSWDLFCADCFPFVQYKCRNHVQRQILLWSVGCYVQTCCRLICPMPMICIWAKITSGFYNFMGSNQCLGWSRFVVLFRRLACFFFVVESVIGHQSSSSLWILVGVFAIPCNFSGKVPHIWCPVYIRRDNCQVIYCSSRRTPSLYLMASPQLNCYFGLNLF